MKRIEWPESPRLDVRDLRVALALSSAGTTAQAAHLLHLTQPAVSRALLALEEKLEVRLFDRTQRGLVPTPAGERLLERAPRILSEIGDLEHRVRTPPALPTRLRLVCECYTAYHWLPSALATLRESLPDLQLSLEVEHTGAPVAALESGKIDVALLTTGAVSSAEIEERPLFADEIVFVVSASHPLAARKTLTRADLKNTPILTGNTPVAEANWFMTRVFGRTQPHLRFERFPVTEAILDVARAGMGIAVLSSWIASPHVGRGDLVVKRLASGPIERPWRFAFRREMAESARRLLAALVTTVPRARLTA